MRYMIRPDYILISEATRPRNRMKALQPVDGLARAANRTIPNPLGLIRNEFIRDKRVSLGVG